MQITTKGQVTIPQEIRNRLGLLPHYESRVRIGRGSRPHSQIPASAWRKRARTPGPGGPPRHERSELGKSTRCSAHATPLSDSSAACTWAVRLTGTPTLSYPAVPVIVSLVDHPIQGIVLIRGGHERPRRAHSCSASMSGTLSVTSTSRSGSATIQKMPAWGTAP
jgi:hypothetical protein